MATDGSGSSSTPAPDHVPSARRVPEGVTLQVNASPAFPGIPFHSDVESPSEPSSPSDSHQTSVAVFDDATLNHLSDEYCERELNLPPFQPPAPLHHDILSALLHNEFLRYDVIVEANTKH